MDVQEGGVFGGNIGWERPETTNRFRPKSGWYVASRFSANTSRPNTSVTITSAAREDALATDLLRLTTRRNLNLLPGLNSWDHYSKPSSMPAIPRRNVQCAHSSQLRQSRERDSRLAEHPLNGLRPDLLCHCGAAEQSDHHPVWRDTINGAAHAPDDRPAADFHMVSSRFLSDARPLPGPGRREGRRIWNYSRESIRTPRPNIQYSKKQQIDTQNREAETPRHYLHRLTQHYATRIQCRVSRHHGPVRMVRD
jgi:hypothetical protein